MLLVAYSRTHTGKQVLSSKDMRLARKVSESNGFVNVLFYDTAYFPLVKSWICNLQLTGII